MVTRCSVHFNRGSNRVYSKIEEKISGPVSFGPVWFWGARSRENGVCKRIRAICETVTTGRGWWVQPWWWYSYLQHEKEYMMLFRSPSYNNAYLKLFHIHFTRTDVNTTDKILFGLSKNQIDALTDLYPKNHHWPKTKSKHCSCCCQLHISAHAVSPSYLSQELSR